MKWLGRFALLMSGLALTAVLVALHGAQIEMTPAGHRWLRELVLGQCRQLSAQ